MPERRAAEHRLRSHGLTARVALVGLLVAGILAFGAVFGAAPARAHAVLLQTSPVDNAVMAHAPGQVTLRFNEAVTLTSDSVQLLDAGGHAVPAGRATHLAGSGGTIAADLPARLDNGTYVVSWRVVSADSHVVSGAFQFSVGAPSPAVAAHVQQSSALPDDVRKTVDVLAYLGFVLVVGGVVFLAFVWTGPDVPRRVVLVLAAGFAVLALGTMLAFLMQYPYATAGSLGSALSRTALHSTVSTGLGRALLVRLAIVAMLAGAVVAARGRARVPAQVVGGLALVALPFTWTLTDHSHVGAQRWLAIPVGSLHLLAVGVWLGGLIPLAVSVLGRVPGTDLTLPRFSRIALPSFAVIVLTGLYQTWRQVGTLPALPATEFGRLLLIKLGGIVLILVFASQARRFVTRSQPLTGRPGWPWLRRSLAVEGMLGVAVLAVATVMVNTSPARASYTPPVHARLALPRPSGPLDGGHVEVRLVPAKQGLNVADIYVVAANGALRAVPEVTAQLAPARRGAAPAEAIKVDPAEPGHYVADTVSIPYAGVWQLQLYVHTGEFDEASLLVRFRAH